MYNIVAVCVTSIWKDDIANIQCVFHEEVHSKFKQQHNMIINGYEVKFNLGIFQILHIPP